MRTLRKLGLEGVELSIHTCDEWNNDDLILVESQVSILHVFQLLIHHRGADDQQNR